LSVVAAIGLLTRRAAGGFALPMLIWLCLTSVGIVGAFVFATLDGEPFAVVPGILVSAIGFVTGGLALVTVIRSGSANDAR
jgi:hypothetical protein